ncbi:MAG: hypothetical protein LBI17_01190 [Rickettsiales bacterium]|jgi:hypothetical protein|nr:hypothetical protein [Rickettsiales bacterium]
MPVRTKGFLAVAMLAFLAACQTPEPPPRNTAGEPMTEREIADSRRREAQSLKSFNEVDDRPIHMKVAEQVKRVVVTKTVVKPIYFPVSDPPTLTYSEVKDMIGSMPTGRDLKNGEDYDDFGINVVIDNYKNVLNASASCCPYRITDGMRDAGFEQDGIMEFLAHDSVDYSVQNMCMVMSDEDVGKVFSNRRLLRAVAAARRECICNNSDYLRASLANFYTIYKADKDFYKKALIFHFRDAGGKVVKQDMLDSVMNITDILRTCP